MKGKMFLSKYYYAIDTYESNVNYFSSNYVFELNLVLTWWSHILAGIKVT